MKSASSAQLIPVRIAEMVTMTGRSARSYWTSKSGECTYAWKVRSIRKVSESSWSAWADDLIARWNEHLDRCHVTDLRRDFTGLSAIATDAEQNLSPVMFLSSAANAAI